MMGEMMTKLVPEMTQNVVGFTLERIEKMVKEVVPDLAEKAIQEEIKRLQKGEKGSKVVCREMPMQGSSEWHTMMSLCHVEGRAFFGPLGRIKGVSMANLTTTPGGREMVSLLGEARLFQSR